MTNSNLVRVSNLQAWSSNGLFLLFFPFVFIFLSLDNILNGWVHCDRRVFIWFHTLLLSAFSRFGATIILWANTSSHSILWFMDEFSFYWK